MEWTMRGILSSGSSPLGPALEILQEEVLVYIHHPCVGSTGQFLVFGWKLPYFVKLISIWSLKCLKVKMFFNVRKLVLCHHKCFACNWFQSFVNITKLVEEKDLQELRISEIKAYGYHFQKTYIYVLQALVEKERRRKLPDVLCLYRPNFCCCWKSRVYLVLFHFILLLIIVGEK